MTIPFAIFFYFSPYYSYKWAKITPRKTHFDVLRGGNVARCLLSEQVVALYVFEIAVGAHLQLFAGGVVGHDDAVLVHLQG